MKQRIEISENVLNNLCDDELHLLINIINKEDLIDLIKNNQKEFKKDIRGFNRIDVKHFPTNLLHKIYLYRFKKGDYIVTKRINTCAKFVVNIVNNSMIEETSNENYFYETVQSNDITNFSTLVEKILIELKPENIRLFFKLMGHELTAIQNDYIDKDMGLILEKQALKASIKKDFEEKVNGLNSQHKTEICTLNDEIKDLENQLKLRKQEIMDEQKRSSASVDKLNSIEETTKTKVKKMKNNANNLNRKIEELIIEISNLVATIKERDIMVNSLNGRLNLRFEEYSVISKKQWEIENQVLLNKHKDLDNACSEYKKEEKKIKADIELLVDKVEYYDLIVKQYIQDIDKNIIENALNTSFLKFSPKINEQAIYNIDNASRPYTKINVKGEKLSGCQDINTFSENIANNLEKIGVGNISDEIANYIIGILASGLTPLICGYKSREVATAISTAYGGETPYIITLPNGYTNARELTNMYYESNAFSILIEDALGTMNENALLPLLRGKSQNDLAQKILILSAENSDSVKYMPKSFFNYVALVSIDKFSSTKKVEYIYSNAQDVLEKFIVNESFDVEIKKIKKLLKDLKLGNSYKALRATIVANSNRLSNIKDAIQGYARCELKMVCQYNDLYDQIEKNINSNIGDLENSIFDIVKGDFDE